MRGLGAAAAALALLLLVSARASTDEFKDRARVARATRHRLRTG